MNCVALDPFGKMLCVSASTPFSDIAAAAAQLVNQHWLVVVRGRGISEPEHLDLMRMFGKPSPFVFASNDPNRGSVVGTTGWHTDGPYAAESGLVGYSHIGLYCVQSPRSITTSFLSTPSFLNRLPSTFADSLRELDGISILAPHYDPKGRNFHLVDPHYAKLTLSDWENRNEYRHALVVSANATTGMNMHMGRLYGFVPRGTPLREKLDRTEASRVLGLIHDALDKSVDVYEHHWIENDFILLDNRLVAHLGHPDAAASVESVGLRVLRRAMSEMTEERSWKLCGTAPRRRLRTKLKKSRDGMLRIVRKLLRSSFRKS